MLSRMEYAVGILEGLGIPHGWQHRGARRALVAWMHAETGEHPGLCNGEPGEGARYNPLNTTLTWPRATAYNAVGVKNYTSAAAGIAATVATLRDARYTTLVSVLGRRFVTAGSVLSAVDASPWGSHYPLLSDALAAYRANPSYYDEYPIGTAGA